MNKASRPRVAILFWDGYIGIAPSLVNGAICLSEAGYAVDILHRRRREIFPTVGELDGHAVLHECVPLSTRTTRRVRSWAGNDLANHQRNVLQRMILRLWWTLWLLRVPTRGMYRLSMRLLDHIQFSYSSLRLVRSRRHVAVIGVDREGIVAGRLVSLFRSVQLLYWSLELYFLNDATTLGERILKRLERRSSRKAECNIIQDHDRAEVLIQENQVDPQRIVLVPNSPMGPADTAKYRFFHDKFDMPEGQRVVVQIGGIDPGLYSLELAAAAREWPEETCLVLHERMERDPEDPYLRQILLAGGDHVHLSLDPVPLQDVPRVVASCDIGLVFYRKDLGPNVSNIAGASGKLAYYLKCRLPIICIDLPGLVEVVDRYECGFCVAHPRQVGAAIQRILRDYGRFQANAARCFEDLYRFEKFFSKVVDCLDNVAPGKPYRETTDQAVKRRGIPAQSPCKHT